MIILALVVLGLCLGSFVNALVWRVHEQEKLSKKTKLTSSDKKLVSELSISRGRSMCPNCRHELAVRDLVPVFSWLMLKGKCRYCHKSIPDSPIIELMTPLLYIASYIWWPVKIHGAMVAIFILWLPVLTGLIALAAYDLKWLTLPTRIIRPLMLISLFMAIILVFYNTDHLKTFINIILSVLIGGGVFYVLFQISNGRWIGGGDVRLGFLLGLIVASPGRSVLLLFLASFLGTLVTLPLLASNKLKRNSVIPFGPFLIAAAILVQLLGHFILSWYNNSFFPNGV